MTVLSNVAYLHTTWAELTAAFGEPNANDDRDPDKCSAQWLIQLPDGGNAEIYDYWARAPRSHHWYAARATALTEWHVQGDIEAVAELVFGAGRFTVKQAEGWNHLEARALQ